MKIPSVESILGDKLTTLATKTTGISYNSGKELELMKQLYDVDKLFNDLVKRFDGVNGGYVRVLKLAPRKGDGAEVRLVTWSK